ncbi:MAG: UvrB/UvrC motif-containing protein [Candidatus Magasanikbacteria bacterium]
MEDIKNLKKVLSGQREELIEEMKKKMEEASNKRNFERAKKLKEQIKSLQHIRDIGMISEPRITKFDGARDFRIEGYDISNISGTSAVGSMVSFKDGKPDKKYYRKFKIKTIKKQNDPGMMEEVLERRLKHEEWPYPDLIVVDGGKPQISAVEGVLSESGLEIPTIGIAKGPDRNKNEFLGGEIPDWTDKETLKKVRDEAHRFAIKYHKKLRAEKSGIED